MKSDARASLDDLAIRWETPRGREVKAEILQDIRHNKGERLPEILKEFIYTSEVPDGRDLRCITLEDLDLSDTTWRLCDLSWASFARSNLQRSDFREANLKRANLTETNLSLARFSEADCARVDFTKANLEHANFKETKMNGAVFVGTNCTRASFDTANLVKCNFVGANLEQVNFANADCNNSNFSGSGMDQAAAKPAKAWGIVHDMALDEFERKVGLNSLTSRTTKKFKGLDVLLKASAALAKVSKKTTQTPVTDDIPLGAPPGMKRLETFKRPEEEGGVVFGASLRRPRSEDEKKPTSDVASASDYIDEPATFDPDDPSGTNYADQGSSDGEGLAVTDQAVGAVWTDGLADDETSSDESSNAYAEAEPPAPAPTATPRGLPRPTPTTPQPAPPVASSGRTTRPLPPQGQPGGPRPNSGQFPLPGGGAGPGSGQYPLPGTTPPGGMPIPQRATKNLGPPPAPGGAVNPANPLSGKYPLPPPTGQTARLRPPAPPGSGPPPATPPGATPAPGQPKAPTRGMPRPPELAGGAPPPTARVAPPAPAAPPAPPPFMSALDPTAPDATADWAKAIGQLMQNKSSITKIVIETGDKSRIVFKKGG